jgi:hypothetical protein
MNGATLSLRFVFVAMTLGSLAASASAQDQTIILSAPPTVCATTPPAPLAFTEDHASSLIRSITKQDPDAETYYLINAVSFTGGGMTIGEQKWFVYHKPWHDAKGFLAHWLDPRVKKHFKEARVFGSRKLALIYVMNGVPVVERAAAQTAVRAAFDASLGIGTTSELSPDVAAAELAKELKLGLRFPDDGRRGTALAARLGLPAGSSLDAKTPPPILLSALSQVLTENLIAKEFDLIAAASNFNLTSTTGDALAALTPNLLSTQSFAVLRDLRYRVDVTKKEPAPLVNLKGIISVIGQAAPRDVPIPMTTSSICGVVPFSIDPLPADMKITALGQDGQEAKELGKQLYDNERKYWFDFSFALPLKTYDDLTVDLNGGQVGAKAVKKTDLYAAVNVNPVPYDTKQASWHLVPGVIYGIPITGKPLKRHLLAISFGLTRVQLFAGVLFSKNESVTASTQDSVTTAVVKPPERWTRTFTWGINLSVKNVTDLLSKKK